MQFAYSTNADILVIISIRGSLLVSLPENPYSEAAIDKLADDWEHSGWRIIPFGDYLTVQRRQEYIF